MDHSGSSAWNLEELAAVQPGSAPACRDMAEFLLRCAVLQQLAAGYPNKAIAHALGVRENTVKSQCKSIFSKLGVSTRTAAARLWLDTEGKI